MQSGSNPATGGSTLLNSRYQKVKQLGHGSYGTVYLALDTKPEGLKRKIDAQYLSLLDHIDD
jgi:serine/threonine protein kinase